MLAAPVIELSEDTSDDGGGIGCGMPPVVVPQTVLAGKLPVHWASAGPGLVKKPSRQPSANKNLTTVPASRGRQWPKRKRPIRSCQRNVRHPQKRLPGKRGDGHVGPAKYVRHPHRKPRAQTTVRQLDVHHGSGLNDHVTKVRRR